MWRSDRPPCSHAREKIQLESIPRFTGLRSLSICGKITCTSRGNPDAARVVTALALARGLPGLACLRLERAGGRDDNSEGITHGLPEFADRLTCLIVGESAPAVALAAAAVLGQLPLLRTFQLICGARIISRPEWQAIGAALRDGGPLPLVELRLCAGRDSMGAAGPAAAGPPTVSGRCACEALTAAALSLPSLRALTLCASPGSMAAAATAAVPWATQLTKLSLWGVCCSWKRPSWSTALDFEAVYAPLEAAALTRLRFLELPPWLQQGALRSLLRAPWVGGLVC